MPCPARLWSTPQRPALLLCFTDAHAVAAVSPSRLAVGKQGSEAPGPSVGNTGTGTGGHDKGVGVVPDATVVQLTPAIPTVRQAKRMPPRPHHLCT
jgi:hypothetical protein